MARLHYFSLGRLSGRVFWAFIGLALVVLVAGIATNFLLNEAALNNSEQLRRTRQYDEALVFQSYMEQQGSLIELGNFYSSFDVHSYYQVARNRTSNLLTQMQQNYKPTDSLILLFNEVVTQYETLDQLYNRALNPSLLMAENQIALEQSNKTRQLLNGSLEQLLERSRQELNQAVDKSTSFIIASRWVYMIVSGFSFLLAIVLAWLVTRIFSRPLGECVVWLRRIAAGDLTEQLSVRGAEEVKELAVIFNRTISNLKTTISRIQTQASAIASTSQQLGQSSDSQASSLSEQAVAISQVSVTVQELSQTSQRIADSSAQVAISATAALESAQTGFDTMLGVSETMSEIRQKVNMIADRILALNTIAQRIHDVTSLINTISNETHLLALNAAIESAGAGEEGARFAIVAGQVRKLSQRSRVAAVEIQQLVSQIQRATAASVMATEEGLKASTLGEKMVMDSLEANEEIIGQVTQTNEQAQSISLATEQQRVASTQLAETLREVSRIINTISVNSQQYRLSAADLGNVVSQLNSVANGFVLRPEITLPPLKLVPATATTV